MSNWGWAGTAGEFLAASDEVIIHSLSRHLQRLTLQGPSSQQRAAWEHSVGALRVAIRVCLDGDPTIESRWKVVLEYELPFEGGRRADLIVLAGRSLVVVEAKSGERPDAGSLDQTAGYVRDLVDYHAASHELEAHGVLMLGRANPGTALLHSDGLVVCSPDELGGYLRGFAREGELDLEAWLRAPYDPLPSLVEAAQRIFAHEELPHVRRALAAGIPQAVEFLSELCKRAEIEGRRVMAFVTGVPGAGKTLVGLRLVYEQTRDKADATFLSGNGPLVRVLQDALKSRVFVRDLHAYIKRYGIADDPPVPEQHIVVFDEAQRAWDRQYMRVKRGIDRSEPELLVNAGERIPGWAGLVGLVGTGQEIHSGEEGGMRQWGRAVEGSSMQWEVHCGPSIAAELGIDAKTHSVLDLNVTLRSKRAEALHDWVGHLLRGNLGLAARVATRIPSGDFPLYLTRDLAEAKIYANLRFVGAPNERFGLVASSHAKNLRREGLDNTYLAVSRLRVERWFNASREDPDSCCALTQPVTEFQCQGLELSLPIICWGDDFVWGEDGWKLKPIQRRYSQEDPLQLLENAYRVLLTRGREGLVIWVPPEAAFDATEIALLAAGVKPLPRPDEVGALLTAG